MQQNADGQTLRRVMKHMEVLCREIGERHLGSEGERRAAAYIEGELAASGWEVTRQHFSAPGWTYGAFALRGRNSRRSYPCFPCFYSCGGEASGPLSYYEMDREEPITREHFADRIVLAHGAFETVRSTNAMAQAFDRAGARALIVVSPYQDTFSTKIVRQPGLERLVVLTVGRNTALDLARDMKSDEVELAVEAKNFTYEACNVLATLPARGTGMSRVLVSAHYDTAPGIVGAGDDASGTALLLDMASRMKHEFQAAPFAVELAAFTGEEYGGANGCGYGAEQYVRAFQPEHSSMAWMVSLDDVGTFLGRMQPVVSADDRLGDLLDAELQPWGLNTVTRACPGCDVGPFNRIDIPTVFFSEAKPANGNAHFPLHSPLDNLDLIDPDKLTANGDAICACIARMLNRPPS